MKQSFILESSSLSEPLEVDFWLTEEEDSDEGKCWILADMFTAILDDGRIYIEQDNVPGRCQPPTPICRIYNPSNQQWHTPEGGCISGTCSRSIESLGGDLFARHESCEGTPIMSVVRYSPALGSQELVTVSPGLNAPIRVTPDGDALMFETACDLLSQGCRWHGDSGIVDYADHQIRRYRWTKSSGFTLIAEPNP